MIMIKNGLVQNWRKNAGNKKDIRTRTYLETQNAWRIKYFAWRVHSLLLLKWFCSRDMF